MSQADDEAKICKCSATAQEGRLWRHERSCPAYDPAGCMHKFLGTKGCVYCDWEPFCGDKKLSHAGCCPPDPARKT